MKHYSDDELDRALFALELEEPPSDLKASILAATVYRPPAIITKWEIAGLLGVTLAVAAFIWLIAIGGFPLFTHTLQSIGETTQKFFSDETALLWLAAGGATAAWLSLGLNGPLPVRERTARR